MTCRGSRPQRMLWHARKKDQSDSCVRKEIHNSFDVHINEQDNSDISDITDQLSKINVTNFLNINGPYHWSILKHVNLPRYCWTDPAITVLEISSKWTHPKWIKMGGYCGLWDDCVYIYIYYYIILYILLYYIILYYIIFVSLEGWIHQLLLEFWKNLKEGGIRNGRNSGDFATSGFFFTRMGDGDGSNFKTNGSRKSMPCKRAVELQN